MLADQLKAMTLEDWLVNGPISFSVGAVLIAVLVDFLLYHNAQEAVVKEKRTWVETLSMLVYIWLYFKSLQWVPAQITYGMPAIAMGLLKGLGVSMIVFGAFVNVTARFSLGDNWANHIKIYEAHTLVTRGFYKYVRHPLYASILLMMFGGTLVYRSLAGALMTALFVQIMTFRAMQEERLLLEQFEDYQTYMKTTGRFVPKWRR